MWDVMNEDFVARTELWEGEAPTQVHENCCPECGSENVIKKGKTQAGSQRWQCKNCGKKFV